MQQKQSGLRDFQVLNKLGEGAFGQVYKVKRRLDGKEYALKKIRIGSMKAKEKENALNEVRILASYNHQFIIGFKEAFYDEISQTLCVVMEFAAGGDILKINQNHLKSRTRYREEEIWTALVHMVTGLKSLHDQKILHRDLKCANVFVTADQKYKLGDLNVSKVLKKDFACTQTGTPYYASPEVWKDQPYDAKSDMWSLGCVLYEMAALKPPFTANDLSGLYKKVCAGVFERIPAQYSNDLQNVISSLLKLDPKKRPDTEELLTNPIVIKHYKGEIEAENKEESNGDCLLQTIKYNPRDLKGLKNILPKANYIAQEKDEGENGSRKSIKEEVKGKEDIKKKEEVQVKEEPKLKEAVVKPVEVEKPVVEVKKTISIEENERKLKEYLEKRRQTEEKDRENHLKQLRQQNQQLLRKKERVYSACGIKNPLICDSPRIAVHKKNENPSVLVPAAKVEKKDEVSLPNARPPRPPGMLYRLPPKPSNIQPNPSQLINRSEISQREQSKENLRNIGARIVNDCKPIMTPNLPNKISRSNSAQRVVYPAWWG